MKKKIICIVIAGVLTISITSPVSAVPLNKLIKNNLLELRNGKKYITMSISGTDLMSNIRVIINGKSVKYTVTQIAFRPESKPNTDFLIANVEEVLATTESNNSDGLKEKVNNRNTNSKKTSEKESYKEYTIKNEIISDSSVGRKMARKYLNETTIIEEIDGVRYITLRFLGMDLMSNIKIKVNNKDIDIELVDEDTLELVTEYIPEDIVIDGKKLKKTLAASFGGGMFLLGIRTSAIGSNIIKKPKKKGK